MCPEGPSVGSVFFGPFSYLCKGRGLCLCTSIYTGFHSILSGHYSRGKNLLHLANPPTIALKVSLAKLKASSVAKRKWVNVCTYCCHCWHQCPISCCKYDAHCKQPYINCFSGETAGYFIIKWQFRMRMGLSMTLIKHFHQIMGLPCLCNDLSRGTSP